MSRHKGDIRTIENLADTKGIDIDDIEVEETETTDGDDAIQFRVYETKAETEKESVGFQVTKVPSMPTSEESFRNTVQNKFSALKRALSSDGQDDIEDEEVEESQSSSTRTSRTQTRDVSFDGDSPEKELLARREQLEARVDELEERVETLEEYVDALEGLQKLMGGDD